MFPNCLLQSASPDEINASKKHLNSQVKKIGILYWQKLMRTGVPRSEARIIAAAIAKYDAANRLPNAEQKQLISKYSPLICRAHLWRTEMLLLAA